ncbi:IS630 transposase-related protein [Francisella tularensis]|uniref:IS630 transposase-related protein n=1 Tax=Francisella tularensis TaxID=263 RepID=UPI0037423D68
MKPNTKLDLVKLKQDVLDYTDAYLKERAERLGVSEHCISYNLKKLDVTYKKNSDSPQSRRRQAKIISEKG